MKVSDEGIAFIREREGVRLTAYPDPATGGEPFTVGYGHCGPEVVPGLVITSEQADEYLRADIERFEVCVDKIVLVPLRQNQFDALVSLAFNIGCRNFQSSTLVKKLNADDEFGAAEQFLRWDMADGKHMAGLARRRQAEKEQFLA